MTFSSKIPLVDRQDRIIGHKERTAIGRDDIFRVTSLWITNAMGEILLAKRALTKRQGAGKWGPAVTGTVEDGESYSANIVREMQEELGIVDMPITPGIKELVERDNTYFVQWYYGCMPNRGDIVLQEDEVADARWFSELEIQDALIKTPDMFISAVSRFMNSGGSRVSESGN